MRSKVAYIEAHNKSREAPPPTEASEKIPLKKELCGQRPHNNSRKGNNRKKEVETTVKEGIVRPKAAQ